MRLRWIIRLYCENGQSNKYKQHQESVFNYWKVLLKSFCMDGLISGLHPYQRQIKSTYTVCAINHERKLGSCCMKGQAYVSCTSHS